MCVSPMLAWAASWTKVALPWIGILLARLKRVMAWMPTRSVVYESGVSIISIIRSTDPSIDLTARVLPSSLLNTAPDPGSRYAAPESRE